MNQKMVHEILKGNNLEQNLPMLFGEMSSTNYWYAGMTLAMDYYSFYAAVAEEGHMLGQEPRLMLKELAQGIKDNLLDGFDGVKREKTIVSLEKMRERITAVMQVLTNYTDCFGLYEYMLNRLELNYTDELADVDDDTYAREILQYIFMEKDSVVVNTRIHQMLSQLPVRMTRTRFCDLLRAGFENYQGMDVTAVEDFVYRVESVAGLYKPEVDGVSFAEFEESAARFAAADWRALSATDYQVLREELTQTSAKLVELTENYYGLMGLVNHFYATLLNMPYASLQADEAVKKLHGVLQWVSERILADDWAEMPQQLVDSFVQTEGSLEQLVMTLQKQQAVLEEIRPQIGKRAGEMMLASHLACLERSAVLLSDSRFVELDARSSDAKADRKYLDDTANALCIKMQNALATQSKLQNRAMMAAVLGELPVFFNSHNEVMDYVRDSLAGCHDLAEKISSIRLMKQIMEE